MSLNRIVLQGRLTKDPDLRTTKSGESVASFTLAVDRYDKETDFIPITAWKNKADFVGRYLGKGRMALVEGRLQIRKWEDKNGNKRETAEVVADNVYFGDSKPETTEKKHSAPPQDFAEIDDDESDLPF